MNEKFDLAKMLEEIKEDEKLDLEKTRKVPQNEIRDLIMKKQKEGAEKVE